MICSGEQIILIYPVLNEDLYAIQRLIAKKKIEKMMNDYKSENFYETWLSSILLRLECILKARRPRKLQLALLHR